MLYGFTFVPSDFFIGSLPELVVGRTAQRELVRPDPDTDLQPKININ